MTFLGLSTPLLLSLLLGSAALLFLLHFLRVRPREVVVPTLLFWKQAVEETRARTLPGRFRHPRTWAFLTLLAAILVAAAAEPVTRGELLAETEVFVLDASSSTGLAEAGGASRFARAQAELVAALEQAPLRAKIAVVVATAGGVSALDALAPRPAQLALVRSAAPSAGEADLEGALAAARALRPEGRGRIEVFTDREVALPPGEDFRFRRFGGAGHDAAITGVAYEEGLRVRIEARTAGPPRRLSVRVDGRSAREIELGAMTPGSRIVEIAGLAPAGQTVALSLTPADEVPDNDRVDYGLPALEPARVFVPGDGGEGRALARLVEAETSFLRVATAAESVLEVRVGGAGEVLTDAAAVRAVRPPLFTGVDGALRFLAPKGTTGLPGQGGLPLFEAGPAVLARRFDGPRTVVEVAPALADPAGSWLKSPPFVAAFLGVLREAAGIRPGAATAVAAGATALEVVLAPILADGSAAPLAPLAASQALFVPPGAASLATLRHPTSGAEARLATLAPGPVAPTVDPERKPLERPGRGLRLFEVLVLVALALALADTWLHVTGRIP